MPKFEYDNCTLEYEIGDCLELMKKLNMSEIDAVITDAPYGIDLDTDYSSMKSRHGGYKGKLCGNKYPKVDGDIDFNFLECWNMVSEIKKHIWFGGDYFIPRDIYKSGSVLVWDKRLTDSADKMFGSCFEIIWVKPRCKRDIIRYKWAGIFGMENERQKTRQHPTQKPVDLMVMLIEKYTDPGDTILDPFMGSGSTLRACRETGRNGIGFEVNPDYEPIIRKRIMADTKTIWQFGD